MALIVLFYYIITKGLPSNIYVLSLFSVSMILSLFVSLMQVSCV